jgi:hypothetical protein
MSHPIKVKNDPFNSSQVDFMTVKEQLEVLGYSNIPDHIIDEFVQELQSIPEEALSIDHPSFTTSSPPSPTDPTDPSTSAPDRRPIRKKETVKTRSVDMKETDKASEEQHLTFNTVDLTNDELGSGLDKEVEVEEVRRHLQVLGYDNDQISDSVIAELVDDLNHTFRKSTLNDTVLVEDDELGVCL